MLIIIIGMDSVRFHYSSKKMSAIYLVLITEIAVPMTAAQTAMVHITAIAALQKHCSSSANVKRRNRSRKSRSGRSGRTRKLRRTR